MQLMRLAVLVAVASSLASSALAFEIEPGKWETTTTVKMPMMPEGRTNTEVQCVTREEAESDFLDTLKSDGACKIVERKETGDTLEFQMECPSEHGSATGEGRYVSDGTSGSGTMKMTMRMGEQTMTMESSFTSKRVGDCD